jgi:hypothetical protein
MSVTSQTWSDQEALRSIRCAKRWELVAVQLKRDGKPEAAMVALGFARLHRKQVKAHRTR